MGARNLAASGPHSHVSAALVGITAAGFYLLMQLEIVWRFHWHHEALSDNLRQAAWLIFSQNQNLLVAALWMGLWLLAAPRQRTRQLFVLLFALSLLYLVLNQLAYGALLDHLQFEPGEDRKLSALRLLDSAVSLIGPAFIFNLALCCVLVFLLARRLLPPQGRGTAPAWLPELRRHRVFYSSLLAAFVGFGAFNTTPLHNFADHPLIELGRSVLRTPAGMAGIPYDPELDIDSLVYGTPGWQPDDEAAITAWGDGFGEERPNIVYLILESVGARNLLPGDAPDPKVTPNLARYWKHTVAFPRIYNTFPGSTRSHLPILTGGHTYTWGGALADARFDYRGPTLPGVLRDSGYQTGLFSAMFTDTEDFDSVYLPLPFDARLLPEHEPQAWQQKHRLNSWGSDEREALRRAHHWLDGLGGEAPWFVLFLNGNTHHPYSVPADYRGPFAGETPLENNRNSLHFADHLIGRVVERLRERGELENTLVVVSGDHGQAFGRHHPTNFLHRNHLYEENIRNFLLVLDFRLTHGPLVSRKRGSLGDIMPTLAALAGADAPQVRGQNLAAADYTPRIRYFHKNAMPEQWGLLDGQWKFIADRQGEGAQLFNLADDPYEQRNVAAGYPNRVARYRQLTAQWYIRTDRDFASRIADAADYVESLDDLGQTSREGQLVLRVGRLPDGEVGAVRPGRVFTATDRLTAWTRGNPYRREQTLIYTWIAPDGRAFPEAVRHRAGVPIHHAPFPQQLPLVPGTWQLRVADTDGRALLGTRFVIEEAARPDRAAPVQSSGADAGPQESG